MPIHDCYTTKYVCEQLNIKPERIAEWKKQKYIKSSVLEGRGYKNLYSIKDFILIESFKKLVDIGIKRNLAAKIIKSGKGISVTNKIIRIIKNL